MQHSQLVSIYNVQQNDMTHFHLQCITSELNNKMDSSCGIMSSKHIQDFSNAIVTSNHFNDHWPYGAFP